MVAMFDEELSGWEGITFQWVHLHAGTRGNEYVDGLAKQGMEKVDRHDIRRSELENTQTSQLRIAFC